MEHKTICTPFSKTGHCKYGEACLYSHIRPDSSNINYLCPNCNKEITKSIYLNCQHEYCLDCVKTDSFPEKCIICETEHYGIFYYKK